ncbi:putative electron transfer flavoprotein alpha-subunit [Phaeomoniella chlamydospora]|uniref:Putative electron transfer flavoprotein alpha-subunit n=1 Tax=Phaeomoniella chlamydospora TaxID=158046 RepID=A0A0G2EZY2_PHACM|nr:putative electron transfer flavoprotein alpha-subunit [Phaeomoniella chlamydospora]
MAPNTSVTVQKRSDTPYQLDPDQTLRASSALLQHLKKEAKRLEEASEKKNLLAGNDDDSDEESPADETPIWLQLTTKQHMVDKNRLKPGKITVPHSLHTSPALSICLIAADPQRAVKDVVANPAFPTDLSSKITKIIGFSKLKARYHTFESRRQLLNEHDVFLADDRIVLRLIETLGKVFYKSHGKRPIPIRIAGVEKDDSGKTIKPEKKKLGVPKKREDQYAAVASPEVVAKEIQKTLACIPIALKPGASAAVKVGKTSLSPAQLSENIEAVVTALVDRYIVKGWRNVKSIHIKGPNTVAMPIWLTDELWTDGNQDVLEGAVNEAEEGVRGIEASTNGTDERGQKRKSKHRLEGDKDRGKRSKAEEKRLEDKARDAARMEKLRGLKEKALAE